ncbi:hypothetical protein [Vibrio phage JSF23]|jgi:hypothetical protein|uniref:Uncharacterized protein n=2 Tax=Icepovirus bengalense TaxID=2846603 RepID=A0A076G6I0_9CAUD|nr:hypothetical protein TU12-16_00285 [Vibrio phage ICP2_2006_A]AII27107.1 hypothetical protein ICP22011A_0063 [Vibrio phage ICP2_2011_A]ASV43760.1 hypothetical protein [Vibrio phage JSF23]WJJ54327.1 hypothetical protein [Vibrio phage JPW]
MAFGPTGVAPAYIAMDEIKEYTLGDAMAASEQIKSTMYGVPLDDILALHSLSQATGMKPRDLIGVLEEAILPMMELRTQL